MDSPTLGQEAASASLVPGYEIVANWAEAAGAW